MTTMTAENVRNGTECADGYQTDGGQRGQAIQMMNSVPKCSVYRRNTDSHMRQLDYLLNIEYHQAHKQ